MREISLLVDPAEPRDHVPDRGVSIYLMIRWRWARFVRFAEDNGSHRYFATYTAYDGARVASHLLETEDFLTFQSSQLTGRASRDRGLALFPRRVVRIQVPAGSIGS